MNLEHFFFKTYDEDKYNCCHFVQEVWEYITGVDISLNMSGFTKSQNKRKPILSHMKIYKECEYPVSPSIVYMQHDFESPHVGIYINDKILHITNENRVQYVNVNVASLGFNKIRFYVCKT